MKYCQKMAASPISEDIEIAKLVTSLLCKNPTCCSILLLQVFKKRMVIINKILILENVKYFLKYLVIFIKSILKCFLMINYNFQVDLTRIVLLLEETTHTAIFYI